MPPEYVLTAAFFSTTQMDHRTALLIIDVISDFSFEDGEILFPRAKAVAESIARLKKRFIDEGKKVLYVNDSEEGKLRTADEGAFELDGPCDIEETRT